MSTTVYIGSVIGICNHVKITKEIININSVSLVAEE